MPREALVRYRKCGIAGTVSYSEYLAKQLALANEHISKCDDCQMYYNDEGDR